MELTEEQKKNREEFAKDLGELLKKRGLSMVIDTDFPQYKQLPEEVLLALKILENHKGVYVIKLSDSLSELKPTEDPQPQG